MSEEEKNLEEIDLLKEAEESEEEIREETPEEEREPLTPEDLKDVRDLLDEVRELRGGLRGAADPNMIQKHLDNFLAALCGETPVDSNVRTSTEYWLKRLADGEGGSTKKIYIHPITLAGITSNYMKIDNSNATGRLFLMIFNDDPKPYTPAKLVNFINYLYNTIGSTVRIICGGMVSFSGNVYACNHIYCSGINNFNIAVTNTADGIPAGYSIDLANLAPDSGLFDDGVNAIN